MKTEFYINTDVTLAEELTGLTETELEEICGRFKPEHHRAGQLKGLLKYDKNDNLIIVHHFTKELLWQE